MLDVCRICLAALDEPSSFSVYFKIIDHKSILEVMRECSSIELSEEDSLPKSICTKCREQLYSFYEFRNLIIKSDTQLKNQICVKKENILIDENADNFLGGLPCNVMKTETKEGINPLEFDADLFNNVEENLNEQLPNEKSIQETVLERISSTEKKRTRSYKCKQCNLDFKSTYSLGKHNEEHTGVKPFICEICGKGYLVKGDLQAHKRVHTGEKPYSCDVCQKNFSCASGLYMHKKTHIGDKRYFCEVCNKGYYHSHQLVYHMRSHTGEKPYMCEVCSKTFREHCILVRHMERHQENVEKVPCPICGRNFKRRNLQKHIKQHSGLKPFECNECGQRFTIRSTLKRHKLLHSGVKDYKCKVCEKSFSQNGTLTQHMRIHSGEKPFPCTECPKEFAYKHHLQQHMKVHHQDVKEEMSEKGLDIGKVVDPVQ